jgi:NADP-dependent aldehyde dehydrogenase
MLQSIDARTHEPFGEPLPESGADDVNRAVEAAAAAADAWAASPAAVRAALLRGLADALQGRREALVELADRETGLGPVRLNGELDRTTFQLRGFADQVEAGAPYALTDDPAVAGAPPAGRPRLTRVRVPVGPVAMFSASNFPFAFSVLGGDTASALAAGCPVVVKAHPGHPQLSRAVFELARGAVAALGLDAGVLQMVQGAGIDVGVQLVRHPLVQAVAFTGSFRGGAALQAEANARPQPIPFYGELGSINPVIALPSALADKGAELAKTLAGSIALGCGQFCTSPGVVVVQQDEASQAFVKAFAEALATQTPHAMLTPGMRKAFDAGVARLSGHAGVQTLVAVDAASPAIAPTPLLVQAPAESFIDSHALREEVFGPAAVVVQVADADEAVRVLKAVGGSLTVTVWGAETAGEEAQRIVRAAMQVAGRVLFSGVPTGVAVTAAQHHGGPWPASTQPFTTSVGYAALDRFLRPVALQDAPDWLLQRKGVAC